MDVMTVSLPADTASTPIDDDMPDVYAENMSREAGEAARLNEQFGLITDNIGYLLHPHVVASLPPRPRIADVGTGTGIFFQPLEARYPDAELHGFDILPALFPRPSPSGRARLAVLDIKQPVPAALRASYDVVHVRLLAAALRPSEWRPVVGNVVQLLRPGGWLQWEECDFANVKHLRGRAGSRVDAARRMGSAFRAALAELFAHGWNSLPDDFAAAGLRSVVVDFVSSDRLPETRERMAANGMRAIFNWARLAAARGAPGAVPADELDGAEEAAYQDIRSGCYVRFDIYVACGQKPGPRGQEGQ